MSKMRVMLPAEARQLHCHRWTGHGKPLLCAGPQCMAWTFAEFSERNEPRRRAWYTDPAETDEDRRPTGPHPKADFPGDWEWDEEVSAWFWVETEASAAESSRGACGLVSGDLPFKIYKET